MTGADKLNAMRDEVQDVEGDGQEFDKNGNPVTNPDGKKLTPADVFNPGDVITVTVGKSDPRQDPGIKIEEKNGKYYVRKVPSGGLFAKTPVIAGDKILELNGMDHHEYKNENELKKVLKDEERITLVVLRRDPDASESSASSVDYDELNAITPDGEADADADADVDADADADANADADADADSDDDEARDDDTVGYDGDDCGCAWCPDCN